MPDVILTPGMDPSLIETGVEGLRVTRVDSYDQDRVAVWFNKPPHGGEECDFTYRVDGHYAFGRTTLPSLSLKQNPSTIDWSKPIQTRTGTPARVLASLPDHNLKVVQIGDYEPLLVRLDGSSTDVDRAVALQNVPSEPVIVTQFLCLSRHQHRAYDEVYDQCQDLSQLPTLAQIELTYTDGILTDAKVVTPNKEPHL